MDKKVLKEYRFILFYVALLWLIEIANYSFNHQFNQYGLRPRDFEGLIGLFTMHFLHSDFNHLIANSAPLLILGLLINVISEFAFWGGAHASPGDEESSPRIRGCQCTQPLSFY